MTCFIANLTVCRSYAKCNGWQETLAHFFIKSHRQSSRQIPSSSVSHDAISTYIKDPSIDSGRESSSETNIDNSNAHIPLVPPPQIFETSSSPDNPTQEKHVRQLDLSPITNENMHTNLTRTFSTPRQSLISNSVLTPMSISIDSEDTTPEFLRRNSEEFHQNTNAMKTTPLQSSSTSQEDLLSVVKSENSNEDLASVASSNDVLNPLSTINMTSIKDLCDDEENNKQHTRLGPELRQILGGLIALLWSKTDLQLFFYSCNSYFYSKNVSTYSNSA